MADVGRHPNIKLLANTDIFAVDGEAGNFTVLLRRRPRYVNEDLCVGCRTCASYCPSRMFTNPFDENLTKTKAIDFWFPQAVPAVPTVDRETCLYFENKCAICIPVCKAKAIDFTQKGKRMIARVGAIIVTTGYEVFDSTLAGEYGYGRMRNVVSSMEFERFLNADGPYRGEVKRPSDGKIADKIAWFQCIGSRDKRLGNTYCSSVCCTYAIKQMMLVKNHYPNSQVTIFHNGIRTYGKGFEDFYIRVQKMEGVRFIQKRIPAIKENKRNRNLIVSYVSDDHIPQEEEFDLVVLSVGMNPARGNQSIAEILGLELEEHGFCRTDYFSPNEIRTRPGIFPAATFIAPMDIPDSISSATGAVSLAAQFLSNQRGTLVRAKSFPSERSVEGKEPRIGVFVCHCGNNIAGVVDVSSLVQYASTLKNVVHCADQMISCASDSIRKISQTVKEKELNRVVVAACTPRTHEPVFQEALREAGINKYLLEMANIREHCSWVHSLEKDKATQKAKDIISMAVARATNLSPLQEVEIPVNKRGLVLGGGLAGIEAALALAKQGFDVYLIEKERELGGNLKNIFSTLDGIEISPFLEGKKREIESQRNIKVFMGYELKSFSGFVGNFESTLVKVAHGDGEFPDPMEVHLQHGIIIIATGGKVFEPAEYRYGETKKVITQKELEKTIFSKSSIKDLRQVAMIQCVGARSEERPYCSRICCGEAIKNALKLKELNEDIEILIFYRDIRTYGFNEDYYSRAREKGILFIRYEPQRKPKIHLKDENLSLTFYDSVLNMEGEINPDLVVLSTPIVAEGSTELGQLLRVPVTADGFFMEAHLKLRPLDLATEGIFLCGMAHYPKFIPETISQAKGAAVRAAAIISQDTIVASGAIGEVKEEDCIGCALCEKVCPYGAIVLHDKPEGKKARIIPPICKGCGACSSKCPTGAVSQHHFTDSQIRAQIGAAYSVPRKDSAPQIIAFLCNWCGYAAADLAGVYKCQLPSNIRVIRVMCSARVSSQFIMEAFLHGIDGVLVVGCRLADCHYISGIYQTLKTIPETQKTLKKIGIDPERLRLEQTSAVEAGKFVETINGFTTSIMKLGQLELTGEQRDKLLKSSQKRKTDKMKGMVRIAEDLLH